MSHQVDPCAYIRDQLRYANKALFDLQQQGRGATKVPIDPFDTSGFSTGKSDDLQAKIDAQQAYIDSLITQLNECEQNQVQPDQLDELSPS